MGGTGLTPEAIKELVVFETNILPKKVEVKSHIIITFKLEDLGVMTLEQMKEVLQNVIPETQATFEVKAEE